MLVDKDGQAIAATIEAEPAYRNAVALWRAEGSPAPELDALGQLLEFMGYDDRGGEEKPASLVVQRMLAEMSWPADTTIETGGMAAEAELARQVAQQMLHGGALNPRAVAMAVWQAMLGQIRQPARFV